LREAILGNLMPDKKGIPGKGKEISSSVTGEGQITVIVGHHESGLWDEEEKLARDYLSEDNGYIPSLNRKKAMEESWSVEENFMIHRRKNYTAPWGLLRKRSFLRDGMKSLVDFGVTARPGDRMNHLSGGNQKKLLLLREFQRSGNRILLSEPSSALDQANRDYLYDLILRARDEGKQVLLLTADPEEALRLGDRIIPLFQGKRGESLKKVDSSLSQLTALMGGSGL
jgi:general nucleoside transport system ATP-binding protein